MKAQDGHKRMTCIPGAERGRFDIWLGDENNNCELPEL
jgi:hypothetical protein